MPPKRQKTPVDTGLNKNNHSHQCLTTTSDCHPVHTFLGAMQAIYGREIPLPLPDGKIHRFHVPDDHAGTRNGWYVFHMDDIAWGRFGSWKAPGIHHWNSRAPANPLEAHLVRQHQMHARLMHEAKLHRRQERTAEDANRWWREARRAAPHHSYLIRKGIKPHNTRQRGSELLIPLYFNGKLVNLQRIRPNGDKRFLFGGRVTGCYSPLGKVSYGQLLYICEGRATGATIHEETGHAVACAMNCGNLLAVGEYLRSLYPEAGLIIAGDDDRQTKGNPGRTAAIQTAETLGCGLMLPSWTGAEPQDLSDFNDFRQWRTRQ
ncbi:DNA primase TraC [compost metagenome]